MTRIKNLPSVDRPREKLQKYGVEKLSDVELLAILLRTGTKDANVIQLSQKVLNRFEKEKLINISIDELTKIKGLCVVKSCEITACFELGKRMLKGKKSSIILSPRDVWERMEGIRKSKKEHFVVFYLDSRNQEIIRNIISIGILNETLVHPREVFEEAIKNNAASIIIVHNHPSGNIEPSQSDIDITEKIVRAGKILDIKVADSIIVSNLSYKSIIQEYE